MLEGRARSGRQGIIALAVLAGTHLGTFWQHYLSDHGFPWDFLATYFAWGAFNAAALAHGELPEWMPYQCMGYPYLLNPQSALFYPPTWVFPLLDLRFTLHAAVVLQCLHVLAGAVGMFVFLRRRLEWKVALLGAVAYHFFGGFYSAASLPEMVRAFALLPWLFDSVYFTDSSRAWLPRTSRLLLPLWVALLATGGYIGNVISYGLTLGIFWILQADAAWRARCPFRVLARRTIEVMVLAAAGLAMAALRLGPGFVDRAELARYSEIAQLDRLELGADHWLGLFLSGRVVGGNGTMASTFVGAPVVVLLFTVGWPALRRHWPLAATAAFAVAMGFGVGSPLWHGVTALLPPAAYSRMSSSDWRAQVAFALVVFAMLALQALPGSGSSRGLAARLAFAAGTIAVGAWIGYGGIRATQPALAVLVAAATAALAWTVARRATLPTSLWAGLLGLTVVHAAFVFSDMRAWWRLPATSEFYAREGWRLEVDGRELPAALFEETIAMRPPRDPVGLERAPLHYREWLLWGGYLQGHFLMNDLPRCHWRVARGVQDDAELSAYMQREWRPLLLPPAAAGWDGEDLTLPEGAVARAGRDVLGRGVEQTAYGMDHIEYHVALAAPTLMVENELYFRGWEAQLRGAGLDRRIAARRTAAGLRAWLLPAGEYEMKASFRHPALHVYVAICVAGLLAWMATAAAALRRGSSSP